jgi:hypothetical protein
MIKRKQLVPASNAAQELEAICEGLQKIVKNLHRASLHRQAQSVEDAHDACARAAVALDSAARERYAAERRGEVGED